MREGKGRNFPDRKKKSAWAVKINWSLGGGVKRESQNGSGS